MADKKISQLTASTTPLAGTEVLPIVQSSTTKKVAVSDLTAGRAVSVASLDSAGNATFGSASAGLTQITITTTGEAADQKDWRFQTGVGIGAGRLRLRTVNDAVSDGQTAWTADRTGVNVNTQGWYTSGAERLAIDDSYVFVRTGSLKIGTAGQGIDFSADGQAAGMTSELLDDYEEGTHTAAITPGTSGTVSLLSGYTLLSYTKVGRLVTVVGNIVADTVSSPVGYFDISLPFAVADLPEYSGRGAATLVMQTTVSANVGDFVAFLPEGLSVIRVYLGNASTLQNTSAQQIKQYTEIFISTSYFTA